jgi:hypothetical protein
MVDHLFLLAVGALGWGISLATYRALATRNGWPMGWLQMKLPAIPMLLGLVSLTVGLAFAAARGAMHGGWVILVFGLGLGLFWSGFLRVGAQTALLLAPLAALVLLVAWLGVPIG